MEKNNAPNVPPQLKEKVENVINDPKFCSVLAAMVMLAVLASDLKSKESEDASDSH